MSDRHNRPPLRLVSDADPRGEVAPDTEDLDELWIEPEGTDPLFERVSAEPKAKPRFHFVIVDYLCERIGGDPRAGSDVTDVAFTTEDELAQYHLTETATRVLRKAFAMDRARAANS